MNKLTLPPNPRNDNLSLSLKTQGILWGLRLEFYSYLSHCLGTSRGLSLRCPRSLRRPVFAPRPGAESWAQRGQSPWSRTVDPEVPSYQEEIFTRMIQPPLLSSLSYFTI